MKGDLLAGLVSEAEKRRLGICNVVVRQGGRIIARHDFVKETPRLLYSVSKTFVSIAIGIAQGEGRLSIGDKLGKYFSACGAMPGFEGILLSDLLRMATGHKECPIQKKTGITDIEREFFKEPLVYAPGSRFVYNNAASYMLSKLITKVTGESLLDYLTPRFFAPLGIEKPRWDADDNGITLGFSGLYLTATDLSKAGQALLDEGRFQGMQLIPAGYVKAAAQKQISTADIAGGWATADSRAGYGYQLWMNAYPGSFRMDGLMGQYVAVIPDKNAVVTYVSQEPEHMLDILALTWRHLIDQLAFENSDSFHAEFK